MRVGVIVAARAPVPFLREAIESVLAQEPRPDEIVLVDHASQPPLEAAGGVRLVRLEDPAGGPAAARAAGLAACDCELIALADSDDVWEPGKLGAQLEAMAAHPDVAVCFGRAVIVGADGGPTGEQWRELAPGLHPAESLRSVLFESNPIPAASALIRRSALEDAGGFDGGLALPAGSDWDLWLRLVAADRAFFFEPRARIRYRRHPGGITRDVAALAEAGLALHEAHAAAVPAELARRVRARDLTALAHGRVRQRRYAEARAAWREAAALEPLPVRERARRLIASVPGVRSLLGRRDPYSRAPR